MRRAGQRSAPPLNCGVMRLASLIALLGGVLASVEGARAADSVVLGRAVSNIFMEDVGGCAEDGFCADPFFLWEISIRRTVSGPPVTGPARAYHQQHAGFVGIRRYRLFLLRSIDDPAQRKLLHADFLLVEMSEDQCLSEKPREISVAEARVVHTDRGDRYCFALN
jgi:hypothetical protein